MKQVALGFVLLLISVVVTANAFGDDLGWTVSGDESLSVA
jgi:hypothetical protein